MHLTPAISSMFARYSKIRAGLVVGFPVSTLEHVKIHRPGVWMRIASSNEFPFDDSQFDIVLMHGSCVCRECVREANRVLKPEGCLFFTVNERTSKQEGYSAPELYKLVREGFDIIDLGKPKWWMFGRAGKTFTICARKKAWREHKGFIREGSLPFMPFRSRS